MRETSLSGFTALALLLVLSASAACWAGLAAMTMSLVRSLAG